MLNVLFKVKAWNLRIRKSRTKIIFKNSVTHIKIWILTYFIIYKPLSYKLFL